MAEITTTQSGQKKGAHGRSKKLSTRIDLTPMVDLGFLLIAFFMITTTLAKARCMDINMPYKDMDDTHPTVSKASLSLTLLPAGDHRVFYYDGVDNGGSYSYANFAQQKGIRDIITAKKRSVDSLKRIGILRPVEQTCILIKPDTSSTYADLVNILDEMLVNGIGTYAIVDISRTEQHSIKNSTPR